MKNRLITLGTFAVLTVEALATTINDETTRQMSISSLESKSMYGSEIMKNIVMIKTGDRVGSGFICNMGGAKWLVTNEHVTRGNSPIVAHHIDGGMLKFEEVIIDNPVMKSKRASNQRQEKRELQIEVASNRDLVRIKVRSDAPGLDLSESLEIGERVQTFGNSDGAGVVTKLDGNVIGIGPETIEVDIPFVQGNSGGAILDKNGHVLGVVTYATINNEPGNWIKTGTRFNAPRRFGVRFNGVKWEKLMWSEYAARCQRIEDLNSCFEFLLSAWFKPLEPFKNCIKTRSYPCKVNIPVVKEALLKKAISTIAKADEDLFNCKALDELASSNFRRYESISDMLNRDSVSGRIGSDFGGKKIERGIGAMRKARLSAIDSLFGYTSRFKSDDWKAAGLMADYEVIQEAVQILRGIMKDDAKDASSLSGSAWEIKVKKENLWRK